MRAGELALFYHSGADKAVVGIAKVKTAAYPEPGADDPRWLAVDLAPQAKLARPVTLAEIKAERALAKLKLVTHSRLSVMPIDAPAFERILALARSAAEAMTPERAGARRRRRAAARRHPHDARDPPPAARSGAARADPQGLRGRHLRALAAAIDSRGSSSR